MPYAALHATLPLIHDDDLRAGNAFVSQGFSTYRVRAGDRNGRAIETPNTLSGGGLLAEDQQCDH